MNFIRDNRNIVITIMLALWIIMSLITLLLYKLDKIKAKKNRYRIKEVTLLVFPWLFGFIGALFGLYILRHKNRHWYFVINTWLTTIIHIGLLVFVIVI